jgi:hypothetical protein
VVGSARNERKRPLLDGSRGWHQEGGATAKEEDRENPEPLHAPLLHRICKPT